MSQYYYVVASLPLLRYDEQPPITRDYFLTACEGNIEHRHFLLVSRAGIENFDTIDSGSPALDSWTNWEINLRNTLVELRARKTGADPSLYLRDCSYVPGASQVAQEAFSLESPLEAEELLGRGRWNYLDYLEAGHYFDEEKLVLYSLKLQIVERRVQRRAERGEEAFREIVSKVKDSIGIGENSA